MVSSIANYVIVGLGQTGISCARYLLSIKETFFIVDSRAKPPGLDILAREMPEIAVYPGELACERLLQAKCMIISPGLPQDLPAISEAVERGARVTSDIDLFCKNINAPIAGITGSNGKSTVTTLVGDMAEEAGINAVVAGNIGVPVLDLLLRPRQDLYILELSSFQLARAEHLKLCVAALLNLSEDHLDYHHSFDNYAKAKHCIFTQCAAAVFNQCHPDCMPADIPAESCHPFTSGTPSSDQFGIIDREGKCWLARGEQLLIAADEIKMFGQHNLINAVAALTIGEQLHFPLPAMLRTLRSFSGLDHRCQWVACKKEAHWFNDSKGTNEAASSSAIESLALNSDKGIILIAGGDGKGADFKKF